MYIYIYTYMYVCMSVCLYVCMSVYLYICMFVYLSGWLSVWLSACMNGWMDARFNIYACASCSCLYYAYEPTYRVIYVFMQFILSNCPLSTTYIVLDLQCIVVNP